LRRKNFVIGAVIVVFVAAASWVVTHREASESPATESASENEATELAHFPLTAEQIRESEIEMLSVREGTLTMRSCVPGKITANPNNYAHVLSPTTASAYEVRRNLGDNVAQGDVLAILESRDIAEAKADFLAAKRREALAMSLYDRELELRNKRISAEQDFLKAHADAEEAQIATALSKQKLQALGLSDEEIEQVPQESSSNLRLYTMRAPIAGTIIKKHMTTGELLDASEESFIIADLSTVWVEMAIYPKDLATIRAGQKVEVSSDHSPIPAVAKIIYLSPVIDEESHTATAIAEIDNHTGDWRPGSFICASVITNTVRVPFAIRKEGLQSIEGKDYVFVRTADGFAQRQVIVGRSDGEMVEILAGLSRGESYAAVNSFLFKAELTKVADDD
jgi:membrane fusion protein, heavy metal efflux system